MKIPDGMTEAEVVEAIQKAIKLLGKRYAFGIYTPEDIEQEACVKALEVLETEKYDASRPLPNFLYIHIRNRLSNLKRDKLMRNDAPCKACHSGNPCVEGQCQKYREWYSRNRTKANIHQPLGIHNITDEKERNTRIESTAEKDVETDELMQLIDEHLSVELRPYYLQLKAGVSIPKSKRDQVLRAIREIVECQRVEN